ncbi:MAG TPA: carbamoyltransferase N-terminal domain-containing protein, partial [Mycobacteriales bacterium]|nr:carbamoyltransferase N-terminal domain-containing protein [Mycobacteriales bacterium]
MTAEMFVSLGHNSSAAVAVDGVVVAAYEQERFDRRKSSSAYPRDAIHACLHATDRRYFDAVYVSHWFDRFALEDSKYLDLTDLRIYSDKVVGLDPNLTHHDAHARSALAFARCHGVVGEATVVVMDGFGNRQECFSVYDAFNGRQPRLRHRTYGYDMSLGLMYQYATDFLGLKQNQDEYKLLGYESRILRYIVTEEAAQALRAHVWEAGQQHALQMIVSNRYPKDSEGHDGLINAAALKAAYYRWNHECRYWLKLLESFGLDVDNGPAVRAGIAFCAQSFLESATLRAIQEATQTPGPLVLTGGSFYNVKLNRVVARHFGVPTLCHPLAGDQGAAMGVSPTPPACNGLLLGHRELPPTTYSVPRGEWIKEVAEAVDAGHIVNVVRGAMEFGPRALCDTTTFALPTAENVSVINRLCERDDAMPFAPVMTQAAARHYLDNRDIELAGESLRYMITTCALRRRPLDRIKGIAHPDPLDDTLWTARPQITTDPELVSL